MKKIIKKLLKSYPVWVLGFIVGCVLSSYWVFVATDRYVSQSHIVLQTPDIAPPELSFASMISGAAAANTADLKLLQDFLLSTDMLKILDQNLDLRSHYSDKQIDYFSRLTDYDAPMELFHEYYQERINIELDDYAGVLVVKVSAFTPGMAKRINDLLLLYGEQRMNQMGQKLASDQVAFISKQVDVLNQNLQTARENMILYQDKHNLISPKGDVENYVSIIAQLRVELAKLKADKMVLSKFQSGRSSEVVMLDAQIESLQHQIEAEKNKLTADSGRALNRVSADYETLVLKFQFAQELYSNSLATLEATRVEAARKLKQISVTQTASVPEYAIEPNRAYNVVVSFLIIFLLSIILSMVYEIIRDRRD